MKVLISVDVPDDHVLPDADAPALYDWFYSIGDGQISGCEVLAVEVGEPPRSADHQKIVRVLAWLMRNEQPPVPADAIERAVTSARNMRLGESVSLEGDELSTLRRVFLHEQAARLLR